MILSRHDYLPTGIFGTLFDNSLGSNFLLMTLEHSYFPASKFVPLTFTPKVPPGVYVCKRGIHQLENAIPFETFEITGVPDHTGILFHCGNKNDDSKGCVLLGMARQDDLSILQSRLAFQKFMAQLEGVNQFELNII